MKVFRVLKVRKKLQSRKCAEIQDQIGKALKEYEEMKKKEEGNV